MRTINEFARHAPTTIDTYALLSSHALEALGALAGVLGVSIALYLQLVSGRRVKARFVLGFYLVGVVFLLMHLRPLSIGPTASAVGRAFGLTIVLAAELVAFYHVYRVSEVQTPIEVAEDIRDHLDPR